MVVLSSLVPVLNRRFVDTQRSDAPVVYLGFLSLSPAQIFFLPPLGDNFSFSTPTSIVFVPPLPPRFWCPSHIGGQVLSAPMGERTVFDPTACPAPPPRPATILLFFLRHPGPCRGQHAVSLPRPPLFFSLAAWSPGGFTPDFLFPMFFFSRLLTQRYLRGCRSVLPFRFQVVKARFLFLETLVQLVGFLHSSPRQALVKLLPPL